MYLIKLQKNGINSITSMNMRNMEFMLVAEQVVKAHQGYHKDIQRWNISEIAIIMHISTLVSSSLIILPIHIPLQQGLHLNSIQTLVAQQSLLVKILYQHQLIMVWDTDISVHQLLTNWSSMAVIQTIVHQWLIMVMAQERSHFKVLVQPPGH